MQGPFENEVKIRIGAAEPFLARLTSAGFSVSVPRVFEANILYDTSDYQLRRDGLMLRLREAGNTHVLTFKGPGQPGPYKNREEIETTLGSGDALAAILVRLRYQPAFRYEKFRTEYRHLESSEGVITLDETPIGNFLELEGPGEWIERTARQLGFKAADYIVESYGKLYLSDCARRGVEPTNMVFSS